MKTPLKILSHLPLLLFFPFFWSCTASPQSPSAWEIGESTPLYWEMEKGGVGLTLLGSIHIASSDIYPLPAQLMDSFEASDYLILEANIQDPSLGQLAMEYSLLPMSQSLSSLLDEETNKGLKDHLAAYGMAPIGFEGFRPWTVSAFLVLQAAQDMGWGENYGIDMNFLKWAQEKELPLLFLESAKDQLEVLASRSLEEEALDLKETLEEYDKAGFQSLLKDLLGAWARGDEGELLDLIFDDLDLSPGGYSYRVFIQRNKNWVNVINQWLDELWVPGEKVFLVVGLGHLIGPENTIELLLEQGWSMKVKP